MNIITIKKEDLIESIEGATSMFGDSFKGLYVDQNGVIECTDLSNSGDSMAILTFSGMGEFTDNEGLYSDDANYDSNGVAQYIVDDGACLKNSGTLLNDDGTEAKYAFNII